MPRETFHALKKARVGQQRLDISLFDDKPHSKKAKAKTKPRLKKKTKRKAKKKGVAKTSR
jgi:hypothetical protein